MSLYLEKKYIQIVSDKLDGFKKASTTTWNFRCPFCGDSKTNHNKKRGYLIYYHESGSYAFHCHNCGLHMSLKNFLFKLAPDLYRDMRREMMRDDRTLTESVEEVPEVKANDTGSKYLKNVSTLNSMHPAVRYLMGRKVPRESFDRVFWTDDYASLVHETFPEKYANRHLPSAGLVYPLYDGDVLSGYQYRTVDPDVDHDHRFVTCAQDGNRGFFNSRNVDYTKLVFVVEGCTDALFLPNCLAVTSSTLWTANLPDAVYVNDCEPRNKEVCKQVHKCVERGYRTCMLPMEYYGMDLNDMVKNFNLSQDELVKVVLDNTYQGLSAKVKFSSWKM